MQNTIFIHGLKSSGKGFKGQLFQRVLPGCLTPDFKKFNRKVLPKVLLKVRMDQLYSILENKEKWIVIGSSFGGLMGALYTCQNPEKVIKLILLAPYLFTPAIHPNIYSPVNIPVIAFHGTHDNIVSLNRARARAEKLFTNLTYNIVDDNHSLKKTVQALDWKKIIF